MAGYLYYISTLIKLYILLMYKYVVLGRFKFINASTFLIMSHTIYYIV